MPPAETIEDAILDEFTAGFNADALPDYDAEGLHGRAVEAGTNLVEVLGDQAAEAAALLRAMATDQQHPFFKALRSDTLFPWNGTDVNFARFQSLAGTIGGPGWSLTLKGARSYGNPMHARFEGKGIVGGEQWIYDYEGYLVPDWPNGVDQVPAIVGSVIRTIPHSGSQPGTVNPAGVVCSFYAVKVD